jgi:ribosomal-protein-alanine N-acetyltransferase
MLQRLHTTQMLLRHLLIKDAAFVFALLNSANWLKFIGERHVNSLSAAKDYIRKFKNNDRAQYWVIESKDEGVPVGIITWMKRDYLDHHDLGFAILPAYEGKGYAKAGANLLLEHFDETTVEAIVMSENSRSVKLLTKLGFKFFAHITAEGKQLDAYRLVQG